MSGTLPKYQDLGSRAFNYTFECPAGRWQARLDAKAWGKGRTILLYFSELETGGKYCLCVFDASYFTPADRGINFRSFGEPGQCFELTTARTRSGRTSFLSARIIAEPEPIVASPLNT